MDKPPLGTGVPSAVCVWGSDATHSLSVWGMASALFHLQRRGPSFPRGSHVARRLSVPCPPRP